MLDNLIGADLSGLSGQIFYSYDSSFQMIPAIIISMAVAVFLVLFVIGIMNLFSGTKTRQYREKLVDMYVASTIRKYAKEDNLNLDEEYLTFLKEEKRRKLSEKGLSRVIEEELSEKISIEQDKKISDKKK